MNIAIVDDELEFHEKLKQDLARFFGNLYNSINIKCFSSGKNFIQEYKPFFDIIFLDIQMPEIDGISIAKEIRKTDDSVIIIFITNLMQYALVGYKVQAFDYIIKPIDYKSLSFSLNRAIIVLNKRIPEKSIVINSNGSNMKIPLSAVTYFEVNKHNFYLHTIADTYPFKANSMKDLESQYEIYHFFRCNNCYLVNLRHVNTICKDTAIVGTDKLTISRPRKKDFISALSTYIETL